MYTQSVSAPRSRCRARRTVDTFRLGDDARKERRPGRRTPSNPSSVARERVDRRVVCLAICQSVADSSISRALHASDSIAPCLMSSKSHPSIPPTAATNVSLIVLAKWAGHIAWNRQARPLAERLSCDRRCVGSIHCAGKSPGSLHLPTRMIGQYLDKSECFGLDKYGSLGWLTLLQTSTQ